MIARKLTPCEFARAIRNGLGSAFLHITTYGDKGVDDCVRDACVNNLIYDSQLENGRANWLTNMIVRSGQLAFYANEIKIALKRIPEDVGDFDQLVWLAVNLYELGFSECGEALLTLFHQECTPENYSIALLCALVNIAGLSGLNKAVHWLIRECPDDDSNMVELAKHAVSQFNKDCIEEVFADGAYNDPEIEAFVQAVNAFNKLWEGAPHTPEPAPLLALSDVIHLARSSTKHGYIRGLLEFGQNAPTADLTEICTKLEQENSPFSQCAYLQVFRKRPLPRVTHELLRLLNSPDKRVRHNSLLAFSRTRDALLRAEALRFIDSDQEADISAAFDLLEANYAHGDSQRFQQALTKVQDREYLNSVALSLIRLEELWPLEEFTNSLLHLLEYGPCGCCRRNILEALHKRRAAPDQMVFEAQWDANYEVQHVARRIVQEGSLDEK